MKKTYLIELNELLNNVKTYVFLGLCILLQGVFTLYCNVYSNIPGFEYTIGYIGIIFMLIVPILTFDIFQRDRISGFEKVRDSLKISSECVVISKILALITIVNISSVPTLIIPLLMKLISGVSIGAAYVSVIAYILFSNLITIISVLISSLSQTKLISIISAYTLYILMLISEYFIFDICSSEKISFFVLIALSVLLALIVYFSIKKEIISLIFAIICLGSSIILYFATDAITNVTYKILYIVAPNNRLSDMLYGLFDFKNAITFMVSILVVILITILVENVRKNRHSIGGEIVDDVK